MIKFPTSQYTPAQGLSLCIADQDQLLRLEYDASMTRHKSSPWWGTAVGFRAMQRAALALSDEYLWSRDELVVVSGHPGPGVLDALNFVTACVDRARLIMPQNPNCETRCNAAMKFEWWVSDSERTVHIQLRRDFVPDEFYTLIDRVLDGRSTAEDQWRFESFKVNLAARIWIEPLDQSFSVAYLAPLGPGAMPPQQG